MINIHTTKRYVSVFKWLLFDSIFRFKLSSLLVVILSLAAVGLQVFAFGIIIYYAQHFASGESIEFHFLNLDLYVEPRNSIKLLFVTGFGIIVSLMLSSLAFFYAKRCIIKLGRKYIELCTRRVIELVAKNVLSNTNLDTSHCQNNDKYLSRLAMGDARLCGRVLRLLLDLIIPFFTFIIAFAIIIYFNIKLTTIIIFLLLGYLYLQYYINLRAAYYSNQFEQLTPAAGKCCRSYLQHYKNSPVHISSQTGPIGDLFIKGAMKKQLDAYEGRIRSVASSRLISGVFMSVVLGFIVLVMGVDIIRKGEGWGRLIIYVGALRFAMTSMQAVFGRITSISRFYPQVRRYFLFVQSFEQQDREEHPPLQEYELRLNGQKEDSFLEGSSQSMVIQPGTYMSLVTPLELNRYTMAEIIKGLLGENERAFKASLYSARFATSRHSCPNCSLRQVLNLPENAGWKDAALPVKVTERLRNQLTKSLDRDIKSKVWEDVEPDLKFALSLSSALASDTQWILAEEKGMKVLDEETMSFFLERMADRIVVFVYNKSFARVGGCGEQFVAVMDEESLLGLGSPEWFAEVRKKAESLLFGVEKKRKGRAEVEEDDELEEI